MNDLCLPMWLQGLPRSGGMRDGSAGSPQDTRAGAVKAILTVLILLLLCDMPLWAGAKATPSRRGIPSPARVVAREDTTQLHFKKTAETRKTRLYVVRKGDHVSAIFRSQWGDEPVPYALIRQLNPQLRDLNRILPGQKIILPLRGLLSQTAVTAEPQPNGTAPVSHLIEEGDSISRILMVQWDLEPEEILKTYRQVKALNPGIEDLGRLPAGQWLRLPAGVSAPPPAVAAAAPDVAIPQAGTAVPPAPLSREPVVPPPSGEEKRLAATKTPALPAHNPLLSLIGTVVSRMKGSVLSRGSYFLPLQEGAQLTLDCALIPVVELDDGTTAFLDFTNLLSGSLPAMIRQSWPQAAIVPPGELQDALSGLQGIIRRSRNYRMTQPEKPLAVTSRYDLHISPDWLVTSRRTTGEAPYRQALFLRAASESPLPPEARQVLEGNGLIVTEIAEGRVVDPPPTSPPAPPPGITLRGSKGTALAEQLLRALGERPMPAGEVVVFEQERDGFNLSLLAELIIPQGERRLLVMGKGLPDQFLQRLRQRGTDVLTIGPLEEGRALVERVLQAASLPYSSGHFSIRIPREDQKPRLTSAFSALRVNKPGGPFYLVNLDLSPEMRSLIQGSLTGVLITY